MLASVSLPGGPVVPLARQLSNVVLMRIAIPQWQGRVSPVFDVAANLLLVEVEDAGEVGRREVALTATDPTRRAQQVAQLPADVLICGAISWPLEMALSAAGVRVISHICGCIEEVLTAFRNNTLGDGAFTMPGCCGRRQRGRHGGRGRRRGRKADVPQQEKP